MAERRSRPVHTAVVQSTAWLSPQLIRVEFTGGDLANLPPLEFTDAYVKILFPPEGAAYAWPFDPDAIRASEPREQWPVTRTYTIRELDPAESRMTIDFVVHGDTGLAGPWAAAAQPGDEIGFHGPGGAYAPEGARHLLAGDEAALPAIAATLERLPESATGDAYLEVADPAGRLDLAAPPGVALHWVERAGRPYGQPLAEAVRAGGGPQAGTQVFVHGNAEMVRDLRRFLFVDHRHDRRAASISGYWRTGFTEDRWQSTKRDFNAAMEADEGLAVGG